MSRSADGGGVAGAGVLSRVGRDEGGATAVEFSFVFGLIVLLTLGSLQVGRALLERNAISYALSQTVRAVHLTPGMTRPEIEDDLRDRLGADATLDVCVEPIQGTSVARVVVTSPFEFRLPFVPLGTVQIRLETIAPRITNDPADTTNNCAT